MQEGFKNTILKIFKRGLIGFAVSFALVLLCGVVGTNDLGIICIGIAFFGVPAYVIGEVVEEFATGVIKTILNIILVVLVVLVTFAILSALSDGVKNSFLNLFVSVAIGFGFVAVFCFVRKFFDGSSVSNDIKNHKIVTLEGKHIFGLSANEEVTVCADLYRDRIDFRYEDNEVESIGLECIVSVSARSNEEVVGSTTVGRQQTGFTSTLALMNGDYAAAYFFRPKTTVYETKNKVEKIWYLFLDTTTLTVILRVKSLVSLHMFVTECNDILGHSKIEHKEERLGECGKKETKTNKISIRDMSGTEFECFCADLLQLNGFTDVNVTPSSGDHGVDIVAEKEGVKYAIQCKHYSSPVGNTPVQEVYAGRQYYNCHVGVVLTNSIYTKGAVELAKATNVLLWDSYKLYELIEKAGLSAEYN